MSTTANHQATNQQAVSRHSFAKFYKALGSIRYLLSLFEMHSLLRNYVSKVFKFWLKLISSALLLRLLVTFVKNSMFIGFSDQKKKLYDPSALNFSFSGRKSRWTMNFTRMWVEFWQKKAAETTCRIDLRIIQIWPKLKINNYNLIEDFCWNKFSMRETVGNRRFLIECNHSSIWLY